MKTTIVIILVLITTMASVLGIRHVVSTIPTITEVTVMRDITDTLVVGPKIGELRSLYNLESSPWRGASFRFVDITNVTYNQTIEKVIPPENKWLGNEFDRKKKIKQFYFEISQILSSTLPEKNGKENSSIFAPVAKELNRLSRSSAKERVLVVYSDLLENTKEFSFYDRKNLDQLRVDENAIRDYFINLTPLNDLEGISIHLLYQPKNNQADERYKLVSRFYQHLFESKGATVWISANITGNGLTGKED